MNQSSLKDNFSLPNMDHVLQIVARAEMLFMLDDFLGYNQIELGEKDQHKMTFTTPWGTFTYHRMPFGLLTLVLHFRDAQEKH